MIAPTDASTRPRVARARRRGVARFVIASIDRSHRLVASVNATAQRDARMASIPRVGARVELGEDGARGVVRYVGAVGERAGTWIGVEFDDDDRGRHDGVVDGVRYFSCEARDEDAGAGGADDGRGARRASMVRAHKIARGRTFAEALRGRYARDDASADDGERGGDGNGGGDDMCIRTARGRVMRVELCETEEEATMDAAATARRLKSMTRAYVDHARVETMGARGEASACAGALRVLGLAGSLLTSVEDVARIGEEFPTLEALDLSGIRLGDWTKASSMCARFEKLKVLVLNDSMVKWRDVRALSSLMPEIEELHLNGNNISSFAMDIDDGANVFPKLRTLSVDGNALSDWSEIEELGRQLPWLEKLHASQNALAEIRPSRAFSALKTLLLGDNALSAWSSVDALNAFPKLEDVRLSGNPFASASSSRHEIIARVDKLVALNGSTVSTAERKDSEIRYLRRVLQQLKEVSIEGDSARVRVTEENPRVDALVAKHGDLVTHAARAPGSGTLASASVDLVLCLESTGQTMTKKLPKTTAIAKLKLFCAKLFKFDVSQAEIFLVAPDASRVSLEPDFEPLAAFAPIDGQRLAIVLT